MIVTMSGFLVGLLRGGFAVEIRQTRRHSCPSCVKEVTQQYYYHNVGQHKIKNADNFLGLYFHILLLLLLSSFMHACMSLGVKET